MRLIHAPYSAMSELEAAVRALSSLGVTRSRAGLDSSLIEISRQAQNPKCSPEQLHQMQHELFGCAIAYELNLLEIGFQEFDRDQAVQRLARAMHDVNLIAQADPSPAARRTAQHNLLYAASVLSTACEGQSQHVNTPYDNLVDVILSRAASSLQERMRGYLHTREALKDYSLRPPENGRASLRHRRRRHLVGWTTSYAPFIKALNPTGCGFLGASLELLESIPKLQAALENLESSNTRFASRTRDDDRENVSVLQALADTTPVQSVAGVQARQQARKEEELEMELDHHWAKTCLRSVAFTVVGHLSSAVGEQSPAYNAHRRDFFSRRVGKEFDARFGHRFLKRIDRINSLIADDLLVEAIKALALAKELAPHNEFFEASGSDRMAKVEAALQLFSKVTAQG